MLFRQYTRVIVTMIHRALDVAVRTSTVQAVGDLQCEHVAIVALVLRDILVDISVHDFGLVGEGRLTEGVLGKEGDREGTVDLIGRSEVPCRCLMSAMFALHEVPSVVGVCSEGPLVQIGLQRTSSVE